MNALVFSIPLALAPMALEADLNHHFAEIQDLPIQEGMPDPFLMADGGRVETLDDWAVQREYIKSMLSHYLYGRVPPRPDEVGFERVDSRMIAEGEGVEERFLLTIRRNEKSVTCKVLVTRPISRLRYPAIIKNDRVSFDPEVDDASPTDDFEPGLEAIRRGYLLCRFHREDLASDTRGAGREGGVYPLYPEYDWASLAVWGWAHGVVADALNHLGLVDMGKVVATGHSRGGKAALCAGIFDERIAITAPNSSGTGGTGSYRYFENGQKPQTIKSHIGKNERWFHPRYFQFADNEERMPFDSHFSRALIAPRAFLNCHAREDYHANPYGTELTHRATLPVYEWMGARERIGFHWRQGGHAQNEEDWMALFDFSDWQFFGKRSSRHFDAWAYSDGALPFDWGAPPPIR